jgi:beta-lactamase class A
MSRQRRVPTRAAERRPPVEAPPSRETPASPRRTRWILAAAGVLLFGAGLLIGRVLLADGDWTDCANRYTYVNSSFVCGVQPVLGKGAFIGLRAELIAHIDAEVAAGHAKEVAVYLRDLRNGPILGINELSSFAPASLLKVPLVFAFMNAEENSPGFIDRTVTYAGDITAPNQIIPSAVNLEPGAYEIRALLANSLIYSDNVSYLILRRYLRSLRDGAAIEQQTFRELGIIPPEGAPDDWVSVQGYSSLFRQLYNATYLTPELSELTLSWLARAEFEEGLPAGIPEGVTVAHKFGERLARDATGADLVQFHDCGIVYYPENPYLLCIMTRGSDLKTLVGLVRGISARVYREVDSRRDSPTGARAPAL